MMYWRKHHARLSAVQRCATREQPITKSLADYLEAYIASLQPGTHWLFPSPGAKEGRTVNLDKPFRRCVLAAELDVKQVVRHTAITDLVQAGVDLPTVKTHQRPQKFVDG